MNVTLKILCKTVAKIMIIGSVMVLSFASHAGSQVNNPQYISDHAMQIQMKINGKNFRLALYDSPTAKAFVKQLPLTLYMSELNGNEKHAELPRALPINEIRPGTIHDGDLMLYGSKTLVLFYSMFDSSYRYTPIGRVEKPDEFSTLLGNHNASIEFSVFQISATLPAAHQQHTR
ncbi:MAG: cyclophilin-like fold protein [Ewingella sp.]